MWEEIRDVLTSWRADGTRFALATVVDVQGSAPRLPGTAMAVSEQGQVVGSISGGCVEGDVFERCGEVISSGIAERAVYGITDSEAFAIGLTCGGQLTVVIEPVDDTTFSEIDSVLECLRTQLPVVLATALPDEDGQCRHEVVEHGRPLSGTPEQRELTRMLGTSTARMVELCEEGTVADAAVFAQAAAEPPRMIIFGAVDFAAALTRVGSFLGYRVTVCDARPVFATADRFPGADEVVVAWPHRYLAEQQIEASAVLCVLTHDPKFDLPLLEVALQTSAGFIGVMGSRSSHDARVRRLRENGVSSTDLDRLRSPIGLDLGGSSPEQTAVSIAAEIIAVTHGRTALPLRDLTSAIHAAPLGQDDRLRA